ncbi:hypothetical protein CC78DRAFT_563661 [Lojkania enalia]|uniref:Mid2 domain-containing protein n=1 Tax=Lojkania enalia TaxID=147567 RepID=A0A9P4TRX8_9PLEO|nr:hypothetical protein CC78DRAFT_563661 [Didymosphaeria enalia]
MTLSFSIILAVCSLSLAASNPVDPTITPPARLQQLRRQDDIESYSDFIGYYNESNSFIGVASYCPAGYTFYRNWTFSIAGCCDRLAESSYNCVLDVGLMCISNTAVLFKDGSTISCTAEVSALHWVGCVDREASAFFQQMPPITSSESSISSITLSAAQITSAPATSSGSPTASIDPVNTTPLSQKSDSNKAWIAGVVVGALALVAIAGLTFWLYRMRRKSKGRIYQAAPQMAQIYPDRESVYPRQASPAPAYQDHTRFSSLNIEPQNQQWEQRTNMKTYYTQHGESSGSSQLITLHNSPPGEMSSVPSPSELPEFATRSARS